MKKQLRKIWDKYGLSCRASYNPEYIKKFLVEAIKLDKDQPCPSHLVKGGDGSFGYRELAEDVPRVDAETLLVWLCKELNIKADSETLIVSNQMHGEGSRRQLVEEAYLGKEEQK